MGLPLVRIPASTTVYRLGTKSLTPSQAILRFGQVGLTIPRQSGRKVDEREETSAKYGDGWAVVGDAEGRRLIVELLQNRHRLHPSPPPPGAFPYSSALLENASTSITSATSIPTSDLDPIPPRPIRHLAFARPPASGEFTDFTARYGALQESDRLTFRQSLSSLVPHPSPSEIERVAHVMRISHLLDLPSVSFSSGQTRRGRIATALLTRPRMLILEDPMAGLDVKSRVEVSEVLGQLDQNMGERGKSVEDGGEGEAMRVLLVLRGKGSESIPRWVGNIVQVKQGDVWIGSREDWERTSDLEATTSNHGDRNEGKPRPDSSVSRIADEPSLEDKAPVVQLQNVTVSYGEGKREVLKGIDWTLRPGEKWHLQGANGSGKTTLLSLILGHHPRSFSLPSTSMTLFSRPRREVPLTSLRRWIGHTSPEIFAAFPRGMGLTAAQAVGSGFEGVFSRRAMDAEQKERVVGLLEFMRAFLGAGSRTKSTASGVGAESSYEKSREADMTMPGPGPTASPAKEDGTIDIDPELRRIANTPFSHFTPPQQSLLLFLRALSARPALLILDEPSQGVDEQMWARCVELLQKEWKQSPDMCTVVVSHYEDEVPWSKGEGRVLKLVDGLGEII